MKEYLKVWWHCVWRIRKGHRICYVKYPNSPRKYMCECNPELKEHIEWFNKHYEPILPPRQ